MRTVKMVSVGKNSYVDAGVDTEREEAGLQRLVNRIKQTWPAASQFGAVKLDVGYFANVIDIGTTGIAITTDGVGSKVIIAQMMEKFDTVGIDCVAMNVNDLICVGARPASLVDYIAVQEPTPSLLDEIAKGLCEGARISNISICGGEIAQLRDMIRGYSEGTGFDLAATAVGVVPIDKIIVGQDIQEGDVILAIESSGIHSNGLTLARQVLFQDNHFKVSTRIPELNGTVGEVLLKPTHLYVREILAAINDEVKIKALIHITSDGLLNLTRVARDVGYVIEELPTPPPIFGLIQELGRVSDEEMFRVYNMGVGFCVVVASQDVERLTSVIRSYGKQTWTIGYAVRDPERRVHIKPKGLVGKGKEFHKER